MDLQKRLPAPSITDVLEGNIARVVAIWMEARHRSGRGALFLFGDFWNADAMYAPVATTFRT